MRHIWMAVLLVAAGCDGIDLEQLVKQHPPLSLFAEEPAGVNCPRGGHSVRTGLDVDEDGTLSDAEVRSTQYVCNTAMAGVLVVTQPVAPGAQCPQGGQRIRAGMDVNGNGELEDSEVTREVHGCTELEAIVTRVRPIPGADSGCPDITTAVEAGPDLDRDLVLDDSERRTQTLLCMDPSAVRTALTGLPVSAGCPAGSTRVDVGEDTDGDGTFESDEVQASLHVCRPLQTFDGDYTVRDAADLAALQGISRLRGTLVFRALSVPEVDLPGLMTVESSLIFEANPGLKSIRLGGLRFVERDLIVSDNALLETLQVGSTPEAGLVWLGSTLTVARNARLATLAGLNTVVPYRGVRVEDNALLQIGGSFDYLYELSGDVSLRDNPKLQALPFTRLERVGGTLDIFNNDALSSLVGPPLKSIGGDFHIEGNDALLEVSGLSKLKSIDGTLDIRRNPVLRTLAGLRELQRAKSIFIVENPNLGAAGDFMSLELLTDELRIVGNAKMTVVGTFGTFRRVGVFTLADNPRLGDVRAFPFLQTVGNLNVQNNAALYSLDGLGQLLGVGTLQVTSNAELRYLQLDRLQSVSNDFIISDNPRLPTCQATALAQRTSPPRQPVITGNDNTASCN